MFPEYSLEGRDEMVVALRDIHLNIGSEFWPIRRYDRFL